MNRNRSTLKGYFKKGAIPTEANFADLIDSMLNQDEDNISKLPNDPLRIIATGTEEGLINFYRLDQGNETLTWQIKQNPGGNPGLSIGDENASRLFIDSSTGNIGIGITNPVGNLDISGHADTVGQAALQLRSGNTSQNFNSNQITLSYNNSSQYRHAIKTRHHSGQVKTNAIDFYIWDQSKDKPDDVGTLHTMTLDAGNVGIGTTSPSAKLDVDGDTNITGNVQMTGNLSFGANTRQMLNLWQTKYGIGVQSGTQYFRTDSAFAWFVGGSHSVNQFDPGANGKKLMTLTSLGILDLGQGTLQWGNQSLLNNDQGGSIELGGNNSVAGKGTPYIDFHLNGKTEDYNVRVINDVDKGLAVVAGIIRLSLERNGGGQLVLANNPNDNKIYLEAYSRDGAGSADEFLLTGRYATNVNQITLKGNTVIVDGPSFVAKGYAFKPGGGAWAVYSDVKLKKNINSLDGSLYKLLQLRGVTYEWKEPDKHGNLYGTQIGMIAQEVEKVFPEWVGSSDDGTKYLAVRGFEALTVEAFRELSNKFDELRQKVDALERQSDAVTPLISSTTNEVSTL